jgi:transcriptional regulator with XRE-family HTH domain
MLSPIKTDFSKKLEDKNYRARFFRGRAQDEIAHQLRRARKKRNLTQPELEKLSGMKQSAISRMEQASYSHWNFQSLLRLADAMDLRVKVVLDYAEDVIREYERREFEVPSVVQDVVRAPLFVPTRSMPHYPIQ